MLDDDQLEDLFGSMIEQPRIIAEDEELGGSGSDDDSKDDLLEQADVEEIQQQCQ